MNTIQWQVGHIDGSGVTGTYSIELVIHASTVGPMLSVMPQLGANMLMC